MKYLLVLFLFFTNLTFFAQDNSILVEFDLDKLSETIPQLKEKVNVSVNGVSIQDFLRGIATNTGINVTIDPSIDIKIVNNFTQVEVKDIFVFLCKQYNLIYNVTGNIFTFSLKPKRPEINNLKHPKSLVEYDSLSNSLTLDVKSDSLSNLVHEIITVSGKNIILANGVANNIVSGFIKKLSFDKALEGFFYANGLSVNKNAEGLYYIEKNIDITDNETSNNKQSLNKNTKKVIKSSINNQDNLIYIKNKDSISLDIKKMPVSELISIVSDSLKKNYFFISDIQGEISISVANLNYEKFLEYVLNGTQYTFKGQNQVYIIGDKKESELKSIRVIKMQYRPVSKIIESLPGDLIKDLDIKEFNELNAFLVMGPQVNIDHFESFINEIDKIIPLVLIEVIIVDVNKTKSISTGINMGLGKTNNSSASSGGILPSFNMQVGTKTMNELIDGFNGFGLVNLGKISPSFYFSIKALEDNGILKIRSTPKLSTINGHEASLKSGETKYYKEEQNSYYGSQIPQLAKSYTWKPINADLSVVIKPTVSGDEQITLDIEVQQSEFTTSTTTESDGPPGSHTRTFKSLIRVKNQETVLLGGLDKESVSNSTSGFPILSRIPILKWIFGNNSRSNTNTKLNIFIKPTLIY